MRSSGRRRASRPARSSSCTAAAPTSTTSIRCSTRSIPERRLQGYTPRGAAGASARRRALVRRAAGRLSRPGDVPGRLHGRVGMARLAALSRRSASCSAGSRRARCMTYALGLGKGRPRPAALLALSGFIPTVEGWEPDLEPPFPPIAIVARRVRPGHPGRVRRAARARARAGRCVGALPRGAGRPHDRPVGHPRATSSW